MAKDVGDQRVLAAAQHIVRSLGKNENMTEDMLRILSNFDDRFSNMNDFIEEGPGVPAAASSALKKMKETLDLAEEIIMRWNVPTSEASHAPMIWGGQPQEAAALYLKAVEEVQNIAGVMSAPWVDKALRDRVHRTLEFAMIRLKEEFKHMLVTNSEPVDPDFLMSVASGEGEETQLGISSDSSDDEDDDDIPVAYPVTDLNVTFDPIPAARVRDLNVIAERMVAAGKGKDSCQVYVSVRKTVLEQSLYRLGAERPSGEALKKMAWEIMEVKIRKWIQAFKVAVKVIWTSEKELCDKVYHGLKPWQDACFAELATGTIMQFLAFAKAISVTRRTPEKLFRILDMYEMVKDLLPDVKAIFGADCCENVRNEVVGVFTQLGEAAKGTLQEFETAIEKDASRTPVPGGAFHPLTRYVMNYIKFLVDYSGCLEQLLRDKKRGAPRSLGVETFGLVDSLKESVNNEAPVRASPLAVQIMWLIVFLVKNLDEKSKLYKDPALSFLFLMNNIHYIVQKVKQSELSELLGDEWTRKHSAQVRVYADHYVRTAWKKVFVCLRDEGLMPSGGLPAGASRIAIKDRFKNFNSTFEEAWKTQSSWVVPDPHLREWLRITIAGKLVPVYREFLDRFGSYVEGGRQPEKFIRFSVDELENYVVDLFDEHP